MVTIDAHDAAISAVAYSPDCTTLVTGAADGTLGVWNSETGGSLFALAGHDGRVYDAAFSDDGTLILTSGDATDFCCGQTKVWDASTGALVSTIQGGNAVFAPGAKTVVNSGNGTVALWDTMTGTLIHDHTGVDSIWIVAVSPDTTRALAFDDYEGTTQILDTSTGNVVSTFSEPLVSSPAAAFSPDGQQVVTATEDGRVISWNTETGEPLATIGEMGRLVHLFTVSFSEDGSKVLVVGIDEDGSELRVFDADTGAALLSESDSTLWSAEFSPDGSLVATLAALGQGEKSVATIWDATTGAKLDALIDSTAWITAASFSPDGTRLVTGGSDGMAKIWTFVTSSGAGLPSPTSSASPSTDAEEPLSVRATPDVTLFIVDIEKNTVEAVNLGYTGSQDEPPMPTWSPAGTEVSVYDFYMGAGNVYTPSTGQLSDEIPPYATTSPVGASSREPYNDPPNVGTATSPDGSVTATVANASDPMLTVSHVSDGTELSQRSAAAPFAWSPDSRSIAAVAAGDSPWIGVELIDPLTGDGQTLVVIDWTGGFLAFGGFAWSPDGTSVAFTAWSWDT